MKLLARSVLVVVVLAVVALGIAFFNLNRLIRTAVERQATSSLRLATTLESARVGLFGGTLNLHQLRIGSPKGFSAPQMFTLSDVDVSVRLRELRKKPLHVSSLTIDKP